MPNIEHEITESEIKEIWERLTKGEASIKSAHHRIDTLEKLSDSVNNLAIATTKIAEETKKLREDYNKADEELQELKEQPVKRYNTVVTAFITGICSGLAGYILAALLR